MSEEKKNSRKYKVMQIMPYMIPQGAERMAVELTLHLDPEIFDVQMVCLSENPHTILDKMLVENDVKVTYLNKKEGFKPHICFDLNALFKKEQPDIIHTHLHILPYVAPVMIRNGLKNGVHTIHTLAEKEAGFLARHLNTRIFHKIIHPVAIATQVHKSLIDTYGDADYHYIPNGINVSSYLGDKEKGAAWRKKMGFKENDVIFVCVAGLFPAKNHDFLIDAFNQGPARFDNARLLLAGDGELRRQLEEKVEKLASKDKISFLGRRDDVMEILSASNVFTLSSFYEGNPLSVMEAMSGGKAVIGTRVGGIPDLIQDGETGLLVESENRDELAAAMVRLAQDPDLCRTMGEKARRRAIEYFDVKIMTSAYEKLYLSLLEKNG